MIDPAFIAGHAPTGFWWQPSGCWTIFCTCKETFDGSTQEEAREEWAKHLADEMARGDVA